MWPCSDSDRSLRLTAFAVALAVLSGPVLALTSPAHAADDAAPDSTEEVNGVRVSDDGIEIRKDGDSRRIEFKHKRGGNHVQIGPDGVNIRVSGDDEIVRVDGPAIIVDSDEAGMVRVFSDAYVPEDRLVEGDVVAVFGSVQVDGEVEGTVVSVFGSVLLGETAIVRDDAVAVGGVLDMEYGAQVGGETVSVGFLPISWGVPTLPILLMTIGLGMLLSFFVGWILFAAAPERMRRTAETVSGRTGASLLVGLVAPPVVIITIGLLFITVIGIPGAFLLPIVYGVLLWTGQIAASYVLGCKLTSRRLGDGPMLPLFAGLAFVAAFFVVGAVLATPPGFVRSVALFFSLLGVLMVVVLSAIGSGALILSRLGSRPDGQVEAGDPRDPGASETPGSTQPSDAVPPGGPEAGPAPSPSR